MRIVYLTQRFPFGEGETFLAPEIEALLLAGHELLIIPRNSTAPVVHDDVVGLLPRTRPLPGGAGVAGAVVATLARRPGNTARGFARLRRTRPRRRALANAVATAQGMWVARLARAWGADHIHAHWAHLTATLAMGASAVSGIPWSFTAHRYDVVLNNLLTEKLRSARFGRFISRQTLALAGSLVPPDAMQRAIVLHMGVALPAVPVSQPISRGTPVMLCPARLIPVKGHRYLIEAVAQLAGRGMRFELWLAGDGPEGEALGRQIDQLGLTDRVRRMGTVAHAALLRLYAERKIDCVVLPSLDLGHGLHEGISVALIEAMAYSLPVIATRTGGLPELLEDGAGILVPAGDASELAGAIQRLLCSAELRAELGHAGRRRVEGEFDVEVIARELVRRFAGEAAGAR